MTIRPKIIVVVEDELLIRMSAVQALEEAGFHVIEAEHAQAALKVLTRQSPVIHVLFTDIHMPGEMDGLQLAHHVHKSWPHVALIVASGEARPEPGALPPGSVFVAKPYDLAHVRNHAETLTQHLSMQ